MENILLPLAGAIIGWLIVEFVGAFAKVNFPIELNIIATIAGAIIGAYWR
jgi:hypothetical protein